MYADLHLHTTFSDGSDTPAEMFGLAAQSGVTVISITDHDSVAAYGTLPDEGSRYGIKLISGTEISVYSNKKPIHILGYYINPFASILNELIVKMSAEATESTRINFNRVLSLGVFDYSWNRVLDLFPAQPRISGVRIVKALETDGIQIPGMKLWDMFHKYFWPMNDDYVDVFTTTPANAIDAIKAAGGIPAIAHPGAIGDDRIVADLILSGLQGIEAYHPIHSEEETAKYISMAETNGMFITGGTDWHGANNGTNITHFAMCGLNHSDYAILKYLA
ncbi:phosphatase [Clostridia bacterium]|nr:phosphatase [Clostridia bacterium]GHU36791.1 phosphatase [Clostridia bacterium]